MSTVTQNQLGTNHLLNNYDFSKAFLFDNEFRKINVVASGADVTLEVGTVIGTVSATQKGKIHVSTSTDGSQFPTGVCAENITIADGSNADVFICIKGRVAEEFIKLGGSDTLNTAISSRTIRDRLASDTAGITLSASEELSAYDNS